MTTGHRPSAAREALARTRYALFLASAIAAALVVAIVVPVLPEGPARAEAADSADFNPGHIISDALFYDSSTMSAQDVQRFLDERGTDCRGSDDVECLKDYRGETRAWEADAYCDGYAAGTQSAAQIIAGVAASCGVNPQVLLVLLEKEQSLVNRSKPSARALEIATGYGCPDNAKCNADYYGFFNQVFRAARQFQIYRAKPADYRYQAGSENAIAFNPNAECGSRPVHIENQATAGLYAYTPYQPNAALIAGKPDDCSAYGNLNFWRFMVDWFGMNPDGTAGATPPAVRVSGADRYATSAAVSADAFSSSGTVYVASGSTFPDALAGSAAAATASAPMLLVTRDGVPASVAGELARLRPERIVLLGGEGTVSAGVEQALGAHASQVTRVAGADRFATAANASRSAFSSAQTVFVASGSTHADALSGSAAAAAAKAPVLLVTADGVPGATATELQRLAPRSIVVLGGTGSVSDGVVEQLATYADAVHRVSGPDRYATSGEIAAWQFGSASTAYLADGTGFADALSGAAAAAKAGAPVLLVRPTCVPERARQQLIRLRPDRVVAVGGPSSISDGVVADPRLACS